MTSKMQKIAAAWEAAGNDMEKPPHLQAAEDLARQLDDALRADIAEAMEQWENGLIATYEMINKISFIAFSEE